MPVLEVDEEVVDVVVEDKEVDGIEVAVGEDNEDETEGCKTDPLAPTYSYIESLHASTTDLQQSCLSR